MSRIITISRQYGSGGRTIGRMVAEKLGIPCYDQEIITQIAEKSGFCEEYIREKGEYTNTGSNFFNAIGIGYLTLDRTRKGYFRACPKGWLRYSW